MSKDKKPVKTSRMGQVHMTEFAGKKGEGKCVQFTARTPSASHDQSAMFQFMQFTKADAVAMATAMMEWAADQRDDAEAV